MSGFIRYTCPSCRGAGVIEKPVPVPEDMRGRECFVLHRQYGISKLCLRADAGRAQECDWIPPADSTVPHLRPQFDADGRIVPRDDGNDGYGLCPIAMREYLDRKADPMIQAAAAIRRKGGNPMEAWRKDD